MAGRTALYIRSDARPDSGQARPSQRRFNSSETDDSRLAARPEGVRERPLRTLGLRLAAYLNRRPRVQTAAVALITAATVLFVVELLRPETPVYTQEDIAAAVEFALEERDPDPPVSATAAAAIAPSVVRVSRLGTDGAIQQEEGVGTGVVVESAGAILTNLHVVAGARRVGITFADGFETEAEILSVQPENDLAVLQAIVVPEGLVPATLGGTGDLRPGDPVIAVGHPFGIGPSVSAGVISGLGRRYFSQGGGAILDNLIQFDAAANPGNSGGPLVNDQGEVVGIVTSILNPTDEAFFVGLGFAVPIETAANAVGPNPF